MLRDGYHLEDPSINVVVYTVLRFTKRDGSLTKKLGIQEIYDPSCRMDRLTACDRKSRGLYVLRRFKA